MPDSTGRGKAEMWCSAVWCGAERDTDGAEMWCWGDNVYDFVSGELIKWGWTCMTRGATSTARLVSSSNLFLWILLAIGLSKKVWVITCARMSTDKCFPVFSYS